jgi:cellulose synthase/poly-beta-1,6-N-acetylglucosamine synthase-like glycosyltransferase
MAASFFVLGGLSFILALHPFLSYPLSLRFLRWTIPSRPIQVDATVATPRIAICTCAYNEERNIDAKLRNLIGLRESTPNLEILVYVDAATDATAEIAQRFRDQITLQVATERFGKTHGMNFLVGLTQADVIVFTDANVMLDPTALLRLIPYFSDAEVGCVCGRLTYTNSGESVTSSTGSIYWRLEESIKQLECQLGSTMGADGSLFAIRRSLHHPPPDHIIDDMYVSFRILCDGYRVIQVTDVRAYEESISVAAEEFRRKARIACQAFNVHRLLWPRIRVLNALNIYMYLSHKLIRWFSIYLLAAAVLCFVTGLSLAGLRSEAIAVVVALVVTISVGYRWSISPFSQITDLLTALLGTGLGVWRSLRGEVYQTWKPAASIRK